MRQEELRTKKHTPEVGANFTIPFLNRRVFNRLVDLDRRIVQKYVNPSKGVQCLFDEGFDRGGSGDVGLDGNRRASGGLNLLHSLARAVQVEVGENDHGTFLGKLAGAGLTDTGS